MMQKETILIIDDSSELRSVLENVLSFAGYGVVSAGSGQEGLGMAFTAQPDLIFVDLELPDTNGLRVLESLNEQGLNIPTIMITGYGSEGVAARALRLGVKDYLIKPFTAEEILSSVERALTESRLRREKERLTALIRGYAQHLRLVSAIGRSIVGGLDRDEVLRRIVAAGLFITRADAGLLLLAEEGSGGFRVAVAEGQARGAGQSLPGTGDKRLCSVSGRGVAVRLQESGDAEVELQTGDRVRSVLQVPLQGMNRAWGILSMDRRTTDAPFSEYDEQLLTILADYAALVLERNQRMAERATSHGR